MTGVGERAIVSMAVHRRVYRHHLVTVAAMNSLMEPRDGGGWAPWEIAAAVAIGGAVVVGAVVWGGAALAATVTGGRLDASLTDALHAASRLPSNVWTPGQAWPPDAAAVLPGPFVYWPCTLAVVGGGVAVAVIAVRVVRAMRPARRRLGVDVRARFARRRDLRPLLVRRPVPGRFVLGRWGRWLVATENRRHAPRSTRWWRPPGRRVGDISSVAIVGPSRSGKTAECAIPGVLDWDGPAVLLSVKRDLLDATIVRRRQLGQVRVFDPAGIVTASNDGAAPVLPVEVGRWSPLRNASTPTGAKKAGQAIAAWTPKAGIEGGGDFWVSSGKILFAGLLGLAAHDPARPSMAKVAEWVFTQDIPGRRGSSPLGDLARDLQESTDPTVRAGLAAAFTHLHAIWSKDERLVSSVYATAQTVADPYLDPAVLACTDIDPVTEPDVGWIDLDWLMNPATGANTLYLVVPLDEYERLAPVLGGLLSDLKGQAYEWDVRGRKFARPLLMLIDEAGNMPLAWLPQVASTCAGIGIQLVTIWQSISQIEEAYGRLAHSVLTNHATKLFFPAASDESTLGYQSKISGEEHVERRSWSTGETGRRSVSGSEQNEPLVPFHVPRLAPLGQALLIHQNLPPAVIRGRAWWNDSRLSALAAGLDVAAREGSAA